MTRSTCFATIIGMGIVSIWLAYARGAPPDPQRMVFTLEPTTDTISAGEPLVIKVKWGIPTEKATHYVYIVGQPKPPTTQPYAVGWAPDRAYAGGTPYPVNLDQVAMFTSVDPPAPDAAILLEKAEGQSQWVVGMLSSDKCVPGKDGILQEEVIPAPRGIARALIAPGEYRFHWKVCFGVTDKQLDLGKPVSQELLRTFSGDFVLKVTDDRKSPASVRAKIEPTQVELHVEGRDPRGPVRLKPVPPAGSLPEGVPPPKLTLENVGTSEWILGRSSEGVRARYHVASWMPGDGANAVRFDPVGNATLFPSLATGYEFDYRSVRALKPGETFSIPLDLSGALEFRSAGTYEVVVWTESFEILSRTGSSLRKRPIWAMFSVEVKVRAASGP